MYTKSANTLTLGHNGEGRWCQLGVTRKESWMLEVYFFMAIFSFFKHVVRSIQVFFLFYQILLDEM